jgi:hypothetical protein
MPTISVEADLLRELLVRRDELVQVITAGLASQEWDRVMPAFDALLLAIKRLEEGLERAPATSLA